MILKSHHLGVVIFILLTIPCINCNTTNEINTLKARLLKGYNKMTHPTLEGEDTNVTLGIRILAIGDLDERLEKLTTHLEIIIIWLDYAFVWNVTETGIEWMSMDKSDVWLPEVFVVNMHHDIAYGVEENRYMPVTYHGNQGEAVFPQILTTETRCNLKATNFPFEHHVCKIQLKVKRWNIQVRSFIHERFDIIDRLEPVGTWDLHEASLVVGKVDITLSLDFARKPAFVLVNVIIPMTMLAFLSPLVFLLPNQSGERVGFSVTILLAISVFMAIVSDHVPPKSNPLPLMLILLFISYMLTGFVILVVIINARVYRLPDNVPIPRVLVYLLKATRCVCCCFRRRRGKVNTESGEEQEAFNGTGQQDAKSQLITWKDVGWAIDMFFMIVVYTLKIVLVCVFMFVMSAKDHRFNH